MGKETSLMAIKTAIDGEYYRDTVDVVVENNGTIYLYNDISINISYNIGYMQMDVSLFWEEDNEQISYKQLGLHVGYNSNFQEFSFDGNILVWRDGVNKISIRFN